MLSVEYSYVVLTPPKFDPKFGETFPLESMLDPKLSKSEPRFEAELEIAFAADPAA